MQPDESITYTTKRTMKSEKDLDKLMDNENNVICALMYLKQSHPAIFKRMALFTAELASAAEMGGYNLDLSWSRVVGELKFSLGKAGVQ